MRDVDGVAADTDGPVAGGHHGIESTAYVSVALPLPDKGDTVIHGCALTVQTQALGAATETDPDCPFHGDAIGPPDTAIEHPASAVCVTVTACPATVSVPVRVNVV